MHWFKEILIFILISITMRYSSGKQCNINSLTCEFWLDIGHWIPMRIGFQKKLYVNETDGKLYQYGDSSKKTFSPDAVILGDGSDHERALIVVNKTLPGPELTVYEGQTIIVHVKNNLLGVETSIHWHGVEMRGTPWMDGAAFVTQCPILPGQTFTYKFNASKSGTYFYEGHNSGLQKFMGLYGAFIVKKKDQSLGREYTMLIQDYNNRFADADIMTQVKEYVFYPGGKKFIPVQTVDGSFTTFVETTSTLVNGRGRVIADNGIQSTHTPWTVFSVTSGEKYRFRMINTGFVVQYMVSIDNHKLTVVAIDGHDIEPFTTDFIIIHTGERFDFTIDATEKVGNYWIRVETLRNYRKIPGYGVLRYNGAPNAEPSTKKRQCTNADPCVVLNCPFASHTGWECHSVDTMKIPKNEVAPVPTSHDGPFKDFFLNFGWMYLNNGEAAGHINGIQNKLPSVSALTQPREVIPCQRNDGCGPEEKCTCTHVIDVKHNDIVQLTLLNIGDFPIIHSPVHLHGNSFRVLKVGYRPTDESFIKKGDNKDIHCNVPANKTRALCNSVSWTDLTWRHGNIPGIDLERAPFKDTITVPAGGYVVIRFRADNPGVWVLRDTEMHGALMGAELLLNSSFPQQPTPPDWFPQCRSFPPPNWMSNMKEQTAAATSKHSYSTMIGVSATTEERVFTEGEFWGMFSALICVIILQLFLSFLCVARRIHRFKSIVDLY
ncbi:LAC1-like protein [Mya arenaria]|uniref:LAC1-like protein n=1 Tax=Mya arenaria TaxID=6604 RepID=A0ABY7E5W4_MYAAR|nr:uncharacterized protein LOC128233535 [Mya arenaria]WAR04554.1 LAC1-like protein [Mya arenaria]